MLVFLFSSIRNHRRRGSYSAIHIVNVADSTISLTQMVAGAVHVTACHGLRLELRSHQLRLHESTDVKCYTSAATIMEDCRRIHFYFPANEPEPDIKDFSFLKEGVPSPNFVLERLVEGDTLAHVGSERNNALPSNGPSSDIPSIGTAVANVSVQDDAPSGAPAAGDDDEEDEEEL